MEERSSNCQLLYLILFYLVSLGDGLIDFEAVLINSSLITRVDDISSLVRDDALLEKRLVIPRLLEVIDLRKVSRNQAFPKLG